MSSAAMSVVSGVGHTRRWATSGTSASGESVEDPITSESVSAASGISLIGIYEYASLGLALPPSRGRNLLVETTLEQIGAFTDAVVGSGISSLSHRTLSPWDWSVSHAWERRPELHYHDTLDWDAHIETPPIRKSGTLRASLQYGGRAKPIVIEDAWD